MNMLLYDEFQRHLWDYQCFFKMSRNATSQENTNKTLTFRRLTLDNGFHKVL